MLSGRLISDDSRQLLTTTTNLLSLSILLDVSVLFALCFLYVLSLEDQLLGYSEILILG